MNVIQTHIVTKIPTSWKIIIIVSFVFLCFLVATKAMIIYQAMGLYSNMKQLGGGDIFFPLYKFYVNQPFPIISTTTTKTNPSTSQTYNQTILNVAFPDDNIDYNVGSFNSKSIVKIQCEIPNNIYFFSITLYKENGKIWKSINDSDMTLGDVNNRTRTFQISPAVAKNPQNNKESICIPSPYDSSLYCVILRTYKKTVNQIINQPELTVDGKILSYNDISEKKRTSNSEFIQKILYLLFHLKFSSKDIQTFFTVDAFKFFLPADNLMSLVFPNEYAKYLMVFPQGKSIKIEGTLQTNVGYTNDNCRYISFMASDFLTTSTDNSLNAENLKKDDQNKYNLYVSFSEKDAENIGYNIRNVKDNLLLWDLTTNKKPVLIYRLVSVAKSHTDEDYIFKIKNTTKSISMENESNIYIPKVTMNNTD